MPNRQSLMIFSLTAPAAYAAYMGLSGLFLFVPLCQPGLVHPFPDAAVLHESPLLTPDLPIQKIIALADQTNHNIGKRSI